MSATERRVHIAASQRWIIKIGSALLTNQGQGLYLAGIASWVGQMAQLIQQGKQLVLVSSGSVAEGMVRLGQSERPRHLHDLQACAAVGQMGLIQAYESCFQQHGLRTAQILLTHEDLADRSRYLNVRRMLLRLLEMGVVPIINENDSVATAEIRLGDNDTLAASVANLWGAHLLVILTDIAGFYTSNPRHHPEASLLSEALVKDPILDDMAGGSHSDLGRGGMVTKLRAARLAARSGAWTWLADGNAPQVLLKMAHADDQGSLLYADQPVWAARKRWLGSHLNMKGRLFLDSGAVKALVEGGNSLLAVGVVQVEGRFSRGDMVGCCDANGRQIACGLVNYSADEVALILGKPSAEIGVLLGYVNEPELIHYDNMALS